MPGLMLCLKQLGKNHKRRGMKKPPWGRGLLSFAMGHPRISTRFGQIEWYN
jgi:hypothetical protein